MRVKIGKGNNWCGPYQIAELICFWYPKQKDEHGFSKTADWIHKFGEFLAHGSIAPEPKVGERTKCFSKRHKTLLYVFLEWLHSRKKADAHIQIDPWDTWNMDHTLSLIILPMLKQLKEKKHGAPFVDDEDVPENLRSTAAPAKENEWDTDDNHFKRWDWVLDEMIYSFEFKSGALGEIENTFFTGESDMEWVKLDNGTHQMVRGPDDTHKYDAEGHKIFMTRIENGFRLFGKYYQGLWD